MINARFFSKQVRYYMVEPITIGAVGYALSTETSQKLFGPTVEYVGKEMKI